MLALYKNIFVKISDIRFTIKVNISMAFFWACLGLAFSLFSETQFFLPLSHPFYLHYGYLKPVALNCIFFGAFFGVLVAGFYYIASTKMNMSAPFSIAAFAFTKSHHFGILLSIASIFLGYNKGREMGEGFWLADHFLYLGLIGFPIVFSVAQVLSKKKIQDVVVGLMLLSSIAGALVFFLGNFSFPTGIATSVFPFTGLRDLSMQILYTNGLLYFVVILGLLSLLYYFYPLYYKVELYSQSIPVFLVGALLILTPLSVGASLLFTGAPILLRNIGIFTSISLNLAVLSGILNVKYTLKFSHKVFFSDALTLTIRLGVFFMSVYTVFRILFSFTYFSSVFGFSAFNPKELSQNLDGYALMLILALGAFLYQTVLGKKLNLGMFAFFWILGSVLYFISSISVTLAEYFKLSAFEVGHQYLKYKTWEEVYWATSLIEKGAPLLRYLVSLKGLVFFARLCFFLGTLIVSLEMILRSCFISSKEYSLPDIEDKEATLGYKKEEAYH